MVSASIVSSFSFENIGNLSHSIEKSYGPSEYIKGWINISLEGEPTNSLFKTNGDSISLIDLLNINNAVKDDTCIPRNCETDYNASDPNLIKTVSLDRGDYAIFGFKFTGKLTAVNSINFTLVSDALSSCDNQLKIDFFNDETIVIGNNKTVDAPPCGPAFKSYGCFNENEEIIDRDIFETPYCQRIKLSESPGFWLGVNITKKDPGSTEDELTIELYDGDDPIKNCELTMTDISEEWKEVSCDIDYLVTKQEDYYVCIYSNQEASGNYKIKGNKNPSTKCGFYGIPIKSEASAYQIFAEGKRFGAVGTLEISNSLPDGNTLGGKVSDYITNTYGISGGYIDCLADCVVPIKFISGNLDQTIIISGLTISYTDDGGPAEDDKFYNLSTTTATVNADFQKLYLDEGNFSVSDDFGNYTFSLSLDDEKIFSEKVVIGKVLVIKSLKPTTTASAYPTLFEVTVEPDGNITKYEWNFGNGDEETTTTNKVTYTYNSTRIYQLQITVTDSNQRSSSRTFDITVGTPEEIINRLLKKMQEDLDNVKVQINAFSSFFQDSLKSILNIDELDDKLSEIQIANTSAVNEDDYNQIMTDLLKLEIPESVAITTSADSFSFYSKEEDINLDLLKTIGGADYDASDEDKYIDAVLAWNQENIETKITFKELSVKYQYSEEAILRTFELKINKKNETYNPYLILRKLDNLEFKENYQEKNESGYIYIDLTDSQTTITFSTTEDVDFSDLPLFISPAISELLILDGEEEEEEKLLKLAIFILIIFLLVIIGFVTYIVLQTWYKKKYESHLFKNRNDLYNLVSYIQSSKKRGLENKEIITKLKKSGWKSEQITYVMKKYSGKRTGMFEIPVGKILSKSKKKEVENIPPGRPVRNFPRPKTFTSGFNPKRNSRKRFS